MDRQGAEVVIEGAEGQRTGNVVRVRVSWGNDVECVYWVDVEHGAVPTRYRTVGRVNQVVWEYVQDDIRWTARGWLPHRWLSVCGDLSPSGEVTLSRADEVVLLETDLEHRPDRSLFRIELPEKYGRKGMNVIEEDRGLVLEPRQVWTLDDFSPRVLSRARRMRGAGTAAAAPMLPGPVEARSVWPLILFGVGAACLAGAAAIGYRRRRRHAA